MRYFFFFFIFNFLATTCKQDINCEVALNAATWSNWYGGIPDVKGVDYMLQFKTTNCDNLSLDSVSINEVISPFRLTKTDSLWTIKIANITSRSSERNQQTMTKNTHKTTSDPKNAKLYYSLNGKSQYLEIKNFVKESDRYQQ